jgi:hypothetical protein
MLAVFIEERCRRVLSKKGFQVGGDVLQVRDDSAGLTF